VLNCGNVGSCHGGSAVGVYFWIHSLGDTGVSYETSNPYLACSVENEEGICPYADWSCKPENIARTCSTFPPEGRCVGLMEYPNATISEYGVVNGAEAMMKEIYARGPIACSVDANLIHNYTSGIYEGPGNVVNHDVSVVGWGTDDNIGQYWIVRNSWGEYWGEFGYIRIAFGSLFIDDSDCAWATVKSFTAPEFDNQVHCYEDGANCQNSRGAGRFIPK